MAQTVAEVLAESGAGDDLTRRRIDIARAGARPQCLRAGFLRRDYRVIGRWRGDVILWFFIGAHADYEAIIKRS